jgi:hypothetical protein
MLNSAIAWQVGQAVEVLQLDKGYQITPCTGDRPGCNVVEIGPDYLVLEDTAEGVITRIPAYLIIAAEPPARRNEAA